MLESEREMTSQFSVTRCFSANIAHEHLQTIDTLYKQSTRTFNVVK